MPQRDRPAVDVDPLRLPAQFFAHRQRLRGEGFVGFDQIDLLQPPAGFLQQRRAAGAGPMPMIAGSTPDEA